MAQPKDPNHHDFRECDICGAPIHDCQCDDVDFTPEQQLELDTCGEEDWKQYLKKEVVVRKD